ncbi:MAG: nuclease-related domain-containing protein [Pseudomonadota bacterium]
MDLENIAERASSQFDSTVVQPLSQFFQSLQQDDWIVLTSLLGGVLAIGYFLGRTRDYHATVFQNRGEAIVSRVVLKNFGPPDYHLINHATLRMENGTTQVDHILVSRFGVFVIETKVHIPANVNT